MGRGHRNVYEKIMTKEREFQNSPPMIETIIDEGLFGEFCRHLSASINVVDVLNKLDQLESGMVVSKDDPSMLVSHDPVIFSLLKEFGYGAFVEAYVGRLRIEASCLDVFLSEIEDDSFSMFVEGFSELAPRVKVEITENGFVVHSAFLIADLILPILSRVHGEILYELDHFLKKLKAVGGDPQSLFLNAKSPTPESQYILLWVTQKLKIPAAPFSRVVTEV